METVSNRPIFVISDSTGETAEKLLQAVLSQFSVTRPKIIRKSYVRTERQIEEIVQEARDKEGMILFTFVSENLRNIMREEALKTGLLAVDPLGPLLTAMSYFLGTMPQSMPGLLHRVDTDYFSRIEAVQYTVKHDDGQETPSIDQADIVLVGPSRTAKTPLSIYLAQFGYKVANIPIILNLPLPKDLQRVAQNKVIGLVIDPYRLREIREARMLKLKHKIPGYAEIQQITGELAYCREIYRRNPKWGIVDVTGRAVEEVTTDVIALIRSGNGS
ncbi:MAG: kinase/pyrophosphorylase [Nitrospirae bacterium]|nr:kinase/pyrophosphorylase [Candidatus Troglogloeales bacterium]MBI3599004.1 kinase/pyrophosphorylase [Candidatus Troglogloeales bacterium]